MIQKWKRFIYKLVALDSKGAKDLHTKYSFKIKKMQRIYKQISRLRFKKWKGFIHKLVV